jgi:hypothetical protein
MRPSSVDLGPHSKVKRSSGRPSAPPRATAFTSSGRATTSMVRPRSAICRSPRRARATHSLRQDRAVRATWVHGAGVAPHEPRGIDPRAPADPSKSRRMRGPAGMVQTTANPSRSSLGSSLTRPPIRKWTTCASSPPRPATRRACRGRAGGRPARAPGVAHPTEPLRSRRDRVVRRKTRTSLDAGVRADLADQQTRGQLRTELSTVHAVADPHARGPSPGSDSLHSRPPGPS